MRVTTNVTKTVAFVGYRSSDGGFVPQGTAFFVMTHSRPDNSGFLHLVTAQHVIRDIQAKSEIVALRINDKSGKYFMGWIPLEQWHYHPDAARYVDVAVAPCQFPSEANADWSCIGLPEQFATDEVLTKYSIGPGDDVFLTGYFSSFPGERKNIPIVRMGNIAAMPDEPLTTRGGVPMNGYLIEARSIGGLSGSPVFVQMAPWRIVDGTVSQFTGMTHYLLGLVHGHYDVAANSPAEQAKKDTEKAERINVGIGVVVPVKDIWETIMQPELEEGRQKKLKEMDDSPSGIVPDSLPDAPSLSRDDILRTMLNTPPNPRVQGKKRAKRAR